MFDPKDKYVYGPSYIELVTSAVSRIVKFAFEQVNRTGGRTYPQTEWRQ